ncbi:hypothetical protein P389DRAFT_172953 [Cystobasidium minutum MCA 4210]|uniref:uncharacterized protein n=1 Tax=Cystobasidium minutum MCA 4210 TaxID=1397322 RepID=UPI0034CF81C7|eukprot:jgi/Rhomi1/172953/fgenesh1_kg.5_\
MSTKSTSGLSSKGADFFLVKFWTQMLDNPDCRHVCEWAPDGRHLIIYDPDGLMAEIKSRGVCKQKDYDSFARQLRIYRWGRVKADECGVSPLPPAVKVWRHPRLNRDSPLVEVANVTRNAPPKPNKAAIAAGLPDKTESKHRKKATEGYADSPSESRNDEDEHHEREGSNISVGQAHLSSPQHAVMSLPANGDIPVHQAVQQMPSQATLPPLMPAQISANNGISSQRQPLAYSRPSSVGSTSASKSNKLSTTKKKQVVPSYSSAKPAFDVETSIFDPNNNFGVVSARPLRSYAAVAHTNYNDEDINTDSSLSSDDEGENFFLNGSNRHETAAIPARMSIKSITSLSTQQVMQAFFTKINYDNAAIEHAAQNPANYDRTPLSLPADVGSAASSDIQVEQTANDNSLASLEHRLQSISANLKAADEAAIQFAR